MVSVIMPAYNAGRYIAQSIQSVLAQTYTDWELLIVDDCSSDNTPDIGSDFCKKDNRIKYFRRDTPSGSPATPRNEAIEHASGRYIAFLDSDDLWESTKLERQLPLFEKQDAAIVFSDYRKMSVDGAVHSKVVQAPKRVTYEKLLRSNFLGCLTVVYDTQKVGKMFFKKIGHEDYLLWLNILKKGFAAYNTGTSEAIYRVQQNSVSSNKTKVFRWTWNILRHEENLSLIKASYCFCWYVFYAVSKSLR